MSYHLFEDDNIDLNLIFKDSEIDDFLQMWDAEISLENIAKKQKRKVSEIFLLAFDLAERNLLSNRTRGLHGL